MPDTGILAFFKEAFPTLEALIIATQVTAMPYANGRGVSQMRQIPRTKRRSKLVNDNKKSSQGRGHRYHNLPSMTDMKLESERAN